MKTNNTNISFLGQHLGRYSLGVYATVSFILLSGCIALLLVSLESGVVYQQQLTQMTKLTAQQAKHQKAMFNRYVQTLKYKLGDIVERKEWVDLLQQPLPKTLSTKKTPGWLSFYQRVNFPSSVNWILSNPDGEIVSLYGDHAAKPVVDWLSETAASLPWLSKVSHRPYFLQEIDGQIFLLLAENVKANQPLSGVVVLMFPLTDDTLNSMLNDLDGLLTVAILNRTHQVVASTSARLPETLKPEQLNQNFIAFSDEFMVSGLAGDHVRFVTLRDIEQVSVAASQVFDQLSRAIGIIFAVMLLGFSPLMVMLVVKIRGLSSYISDFIEQDLPLDIRDVDVKNEMFKIEQQFYVLTEVISLYQAKKDRLSATKKELTRLLNESGETIVDLKRIKMLTELQGMGIAFVYDGEVEPLNHVMKCYADEVGSLNFFSLPDGVMKEQKDIVDKRKQKRQFDIQRFCILDKDMLQVFEINESKKVQESQDLLNSFSDRNPYPVMRVSLDTGRVIYANVAADTLLKKMQVNDGEKLPSSWFEQLTHLILVQAFDNMTVPIGESFYRFALHANSAERSVDLYGQESTKDRLLVEQSNKIEAILNSVMDGVLLLDVDGSIIQINSAATQITGYGDNAIGRDLTLLGSDQQDDEFYDRLWQSLLKEKSWQGDMWIRHHDARVFPAFVRLRSIDDQNNNTVSYVVIISDMTMHKEKEAQLSQSTYRDPLTQLPDRSLLKNRLEQAMREADQEQRELALLFLDLDDFKIVNDTWGRDIGDLMLKEVATRLQHLVPATDAVSRLEGDEFTVLLTDTTKEADVADMAQKIVDELSSHYHLKGKEVKGSVSIGIALYPQDSIDPDMLIKKADLAMYKAKKKNKNTYAFSTTAVATTKD